MTYTISEITVVQVENSKVLDFKFRVLREEDFTLLYQWLNSPHITKFWPGNPSLEKVKSDYSQKLAEDFIVPYMVTLNNQSFGFIQLYWASKVGGGWWQDIKDPDCVGIDFFIGDETNTGSGKGAEMIKAFLDFICENHRVTKVISDPSPSNPASIRCLEKAGFRNRGLIDTPDGKSILMEYKNLNSLNRI